MICATLSYGLILVGGEVHGIERKVCVKGVKVRKMGGMLFRRL